MELTPLASLSFDPVASALAADLEDLAAQINAHRPLPTDLVRSIDADLRDQRVQKSAAIEGNTLTLRETRAILETGQLIDVGKPREEREILNLGRAIEKLEEWVGGDRSDVPGVDTVLKLHGEVLDGLRPDAGCYRTGRVMLIGAKHQPPKPEHVPELVEEALQQAAASSGPPVLTAAWLHWAIARIHPFTGGNGRMARLLQDAVLLRNQFTPGIIPSELRPDYFRALGAADDGEFADLVALTANAAASTARTYLAKIRERDEVGNWAAVLVGEAGARAEDAAELEFRRWDRQVRDFRLAMERCAAQINQVSDKFDFDLHPEPLIERSTYELVRSGGGHAPWLFRLSAGGGGRRHSYVFFLARNFWAETDPDYARSPQVAILVSERIGGDEVQVLDRLSHEAPHPVRLRKLLVREGRLEPVMNYHG